MAVFANPPGNLPLPSSDGAEDEAAHIQEAVQAALTAFGPVTSLDLNLKRGFGFVTFAAGAHEQQCLR